MRYTLNCITALSTLIISLWALESMAQTDSPAAAESELGLFAVEITTGPGWDDSIAPNEQAFFKEHSANLKALRAAGHIVMGARYSDKGLIIFSATSMDEVRVMMDQDPSMKAGTFVYDVYHFSVFYPGLVQAAPKQ